MLRVLFALLAGLSVSSGLGVVLNRRPLYAALSLVVNMLSLAVIFLMLSAQFLAAAQVIVYAGAVMVLFVFVIALLNPAREEALVSDPRQLLFGAVVGLGFALVAGIGFLGLTQGFGGSTDLGSGVSLGSIQSLGRALYQDFAYPFEATSLVLVVAAVGAVYLSRGR
ncbi:MAG: NADH-quinone oxidoreductase subunit [Chloroflexota bacterium]|jgi:NADH-quinone oxidoreductase subunit J|nr:NADH-quinone oxidoreductase subunit [Chloroflexota bacterium]